MNSSIFTQSPSLAKRVRHLDFKGKQRLNQAPHSSPVKRMSYKQAFSAWFEALPSQVGEDFFALHEEEFFEKHAQYTSTLPDPLAFSRKRKASKPLEETILEDLDDFEFSKNLDEWFAAYDFEQKKKRVISTPDSKYEELQKFTRQLQGAFKAVLKHHHDVLNVCEDKFFQVYDQISLGRRWNSNHGIAHGAMLKAFNSALHIHALSDNLKLNGRNEEVFQSLIEKDKACECGDCFVCTGDVAKLNKKVCECGDCFVCTGDAQKLLKTPNNN